MKKAVLIFIIFLIFPNIAYSASRSRYTLLDTGMRVANMTTTHAGVAWSVKIRNNVDERLYLYIEVFFVDKDNVRIDKTTKRVDLEPKQTGEASDIYEVPIDIFGKITDIRVRIREV